MIFLVVGPGGTPHCAERLKAFQQIVTEFEVLLAQEKTEGPTTTLTYLGIQLDTVKGSSSLPPEKLSVLADLLTATLGKEKCMLKQFQSLLGHLNFACKAVVEHFEPD